MNSSECLKEQMCRLWQKNKSISFECEIVTLVLHTVCAGAMCFIWAMNPNQCKSAKSAMQIYCLTLLKREKANKQSEIFQTFKGPTQRQKRCNLNLFSDSVHVETKSWIISRNIWMYFGYGNPILITLYIQYPSIWSISLLTY